MKKLVSSPIIFHNLLLIYIDTITETHSTSTLHEQHNTDFKLPPHILEHMDNFQFMDHNLYFWYPPIPQILSDKWIDWAEQTEERIQELKKELIYLEEKVEYQVKAEVLTCELKRLDTIEKKVMEKKVTTLEREGKRQQGRT